VRLGKRSTRGWAGRGGQLIRPVIVLAFGGVLSIAADAHGASVGPGRIVCNALFCELGSGAKPKERVRVIISDLPQDEVRRLRQCTGVSKPCIVKIDGTEQDSPMKIIATRIYWQE
jgi:hypothetical protein